MILRLANVPRHRSFENYREPAPRKRIVMSNRNVESYNPSRRFKLIVIEFCFRIIVSVFVCHLRANGYNPLGEGTATYLPGQFHYFIYGFILIRPGGKLV